MENPKHEFLKLAKVRPNGPDGSIIIDCGDGNGYPKGTDPYAYILKDIIVGIVPAGIGTDRIPIQMTHLYLYGSNLPINVFEKAEDIMKLLK